MKIFSKIEPQHKVLMLLIGLIPLMIYCSRKQNEPPTEESHLLFRINPQVELAPKYSEFYSGFEIIPLETTENNLTGRTYTVRIIGDRIYVCDKSEHKFIDTYTLEGEFLVRIQNVGRGPDEYMEISDYDVDLVTGDVMILDVLSNKEVLVFDGNTGLYKKSIPLPPPGRFESFIKHGDKFLFHTGRGSADDPESAMIYVSNEKGELLEKHLYFSQDGIEPFPAHQRGGFNGRFYRTEEGIRISCSWDNTVYSYEDGVVSKYLTIDDSVYEPPHELMASFESLPSIARPRKGVSIYTENETHIFIRYLLVSGLHTTIIKNKVTGEKDDFIRMTNDLLMSNIAGTVWGIYKDRIIFSHFPSGYRDRGNNLFDEIKSGTIPMDSEKAERLIDKMIRNTEQGGGASNPILILYRLKD